MEEVAHAILTMQVRGAPLIGATAAYGVCLALRRGRSDEALERAIAHLGKQRPTAINLHWALEEMRKAVRNLPRERRVAAAYARAAEICDDDVETNRRIGANGLKLIEDIAASKAAGRDGQRADALQCRLARLRRLGHGDGADLPGARQGLAASMSGSTRRGRAIRARRSPPSSSARTACRTRSSPTTPAGT